MQEKRSKAGSARRNRDELLAAVDREIRQAGALGVVFSQSIAARLGISPTDLESLDLIGTRESVTAGELATATGLTTGAVTGIIDRLERIGFARRERDLTDRRRVNVRVLPEALKRAGPFYSSLAKRMAKVLADYSDEELALFVDFFSRTREVMTGEIEKLAQSKR